MRNTLTVKTISELNDFKFFIPYYQRGFRWTTKEVEDLLNDIADFVPKQINDPDENTWYCLQPLVIKMNEKEQYEVIDGQQRLTTIYLILYYLNQCMMESFRDDLFKLTYETRTSISTFLNSLSFKEIDDCNIETYYISIAYKCIHEWFDEKKRSFDWHGFQSKFKHHTKIIWYETVEEDPISIFTRINIGKIPLTNAELIKALFLNRENFDERDATRVRLRQLEISSEWDRIEQKLRNDEFWGFLKGNDSLENRIELIFDLMNEESNSNDRYSTFRFFYKKFRNKNYSVMEENWGEVKTTFQTLEEWFNERELYHKIGYLLALKDQSVNILDLLILSKDKTKKRFKEELEIRVKKTLKKISLDMLTYESKKDVRKVLLLYNIQLVLNSGHNYTRFPFTLYHKQAWDIEHITSITDSPPGESESTIQKQWLEDTIKFIENKELKIEVAEYLEEGNGYDEFLTLFNNIIKHFHENLEEGEDLNHISNLTLLDRTTNRSYKNDVFPLKRKKIIEREKSGAFVPVGTRNVFLKYFSDYPPKISFWTPEDKEKYLQDLINFLKPYVSYDD